jgi:hypothetical protein
MGIPDRVGQLYRLGVGQRRAGRVGVDSHRHLHRLENERFNRTRAFIQEKLSPGLPGLFFRL